MKAETLKKAILQYAMQGKLVKQNPNDEPASILLERIKIEKEQLIKDGKIKKEKPIPPITEDEIPYKLPKGWVWVRLGNIINISSGRFLPSNEMKTKGTIPVYGGNGINGYHNEYLIDKPTLIIGRVGFYCGCVHLSTDKAWVTDNAFITTFSENNVNINFLKWLLIASDLGKNDNATAQPVVSAKKIYPLVVALPPLAEQERIVEKLEQILPLVEEYGKNEEKLSKLNSTLPNKIKQSVLKYAMQGKLVEQNPSDKPVSELLKQIKAEKEQLIKDGKIKKEKPLSPIIEDEIPYKLPNGWEWVKFGSIVNYNIGRTPSRKEPTYWRNDIPWVSIADMSDMGYIDTTKEKISKLAFEKCFKSEIIPKNTLIMSFKLTVGKVSILNIDALHNEAIISIFPLQDNGFIIRNYLLYFLPLIAQTGNTKTAIKGNTLNTESINNLLIPFPPLPEQQRIVDKVNRLMKFIETLANKNRLVKASASNLLKSVEKEYFAEHSCKRSNTIDIKEKRAILSAEIISQLHNEQYFGVIKLEKILYLCEKHLNINLGGNYKKEAAGPHDAQSRYEVEDILKNKKWFSVHKEQKNNLEVTKYTPLEKSNEIPKIFNNVFNTEAVEINNLLELFRGKNSDFCESIATLYAVWKNRLSKNLSCSDSDLISDFKAWSKQKARFYDSDLQDRIFFMKRKNLIPNSNIK